MVDREIDDILEKAAGVPHAVDPALLQRIATSIQPNLRPVRTMLPAWLLTGVLMLICAVVALLGAARAGFDGLHKLSAFDRTLIFLLLAIFLWSAAASTVNEMIPGSRRAVPPAFLLLSCGVAWIALFAAIFHDYGMKHFFTQGLTCLSTGLLHAIPAAIAIWLVLRRGFVVNPRAAGLVTGILAGLAGVTMLELHCGDFQLIHVMIWHTAVVVLSGAAGAWLGPRIHPPASQVFQHR